jgi:hypothetical protein
MKTFNTLKHSVAIAALVLSGMALSQAQANPIIILFNSPANDVGSSSHAYSSGGLSLTATEYTCAGLCSSTAGNTYSSTKDLYGNSDGLGLANNQQGSEFEIPNNEFIQLNLTTLLASNTVSSIQFTMTDIITAWSLYTSSAAGKLEGSGTEIVNNAGSGTKTFTITSPTAADDLISVVAGNNCDVVLESITITLSGSGTQGTAPEPATLAMTGLALLGLGAILKKTRKQA